MKIITSLFVFLLLNAGFVLAQKIGHLNGRELLMMMPDRAVIEEQINSQTAEMEKTIVAMQDDYKMRVEEFQQHPEWSNEIKNEKYNAIIKLEKDMKDFTATAEAELEKKESELLAPVYTKIQEAIQAVAKENGFIYIIDSSQGVLLYEGGEDVLPLVKKKLAIE
jgi:outer membrane protein